MAKTSLLWDGLRSEGVGLPDQAGSIPSPRSSAQRGLWSGFLRSAARFPRRPAVLAEGKLFSYEELRELACRIAATIQRYPECSPTPVTGVFAYRSPTAFAGVLGALLAGNG